MNTLFAGGSMARKVEIIRPEIATKESGIKKLRVAGYARVSTDSFEQENSFEYQKKYLEDKIKARSDWELVGVFADQGISGTKDDRPEFLRMINMALMGNIDAIITKSISRFSRSLKHLIEYTQLLSDAGVNVIFEEENIDLNKNGSMILKLLGVIAEMEVNNTREHINHRLQSKMAKGEYVGMPTPLGYKLENGKLVIDEDEARYVRYIYKRYLDGIGARTIGKELEQLGVKTKKGNSIWHESTVMDILKNEKYMGTLIQGKTVSVKPHVRKANNNLGNLYKIEDAHPAIISKEDWERVQEIREKRIASVSNNYRRGTKANSEQYVFSSKLECGYCGASYVRRSTHPGGKYEKAIWQCSTYAKRGKSSCPHCKAIREDALRTAFVKSIKCFLKADNNTISISERTFNKHIKEIQNNIIRSNQSIASFGKTIKAEQTKLNRLIDMYLDGKINDKEYSERRKAIEERIDRLSHQSEAERDKVNEIKASIDALTKIRELIEREDIDAFNDDLFKLIVKKIVIGSPEYDDPKRLTFIYNSKCFDIPSLLTEPLDQNEVKYRIDKDGKIYTRDGELLKDIVFSDMGEVEDVDHNDFFEGLSERSDEPNSTSEMYTLYNSTARGISCIDVSSRVVTTD